MADAMAERKLWFEKIPRETLAATLAGEGASEMLLGSGGDWFPASDGWYPVSHTFTLQDDGTGVFTVLFEREGED